MEIYELGGVRAWGWGLSRILTLEGCLKAFGWCWLDVLLRRRGTKGSAAIFEKRTNRTLGGGNIWEVEGGGELFRK